MVGDDAINAGEFTDRRLVRVFRGLAGARRCRECTAGLLDLPDQGGVFGNGHAGALVEQVGVLSVRRRIGSRTQGDLLRRGHERAAQTLGDRGQ